MARDVTNRGGVRGGIPPGIHAYPGSSKSPSEVPRQKNCNLSRAGLPVEMFTTTWLCVVLLLSRHQIVNAFASLRIYVRS